MRLEGTPLPLHAFPAETRTNRAFADFDLARWDVVYLPDSMLGLLDDPPLRQEDFIEDDNRGAMLPDPVVTLDGMPFYLSVKGVGSAVDPFSQRPLDRESAAELSRDADVRARLRRAPRTSSDRVLTGELWLRGSPYGGQGLPHASTALQVSERADLTSINGFRLAPTVKIAFLPPVLEERLRSISWYRRYPGRMVQELRLVPSNFRVYFHARQTIGTGIRHIFDAFSIDSNAKALDFELKFLRSGIGLLTLFARTMAREEGGAAYRGLDLYDVWLDKDAVLAPDGTIYFVDLEGIEEIRVLEAGVREKIEDQFDRSFYECLYAFEQIDGERRRRWGDASDRRGHLARMWPAALREDPLVRVVEEGSSLLLEVRNLDRDERLYTRVPLLDR
jgi:hypothetical protein